MNDQFVSPKIASKLKKLGFDVPCFAYYKHSVLLNTPWNYTESQKKLDYIFGDGIEDVTLAPLYQQVVDWFIETKNIEITTKSWGKDKIEWLWSVHPVGKQSTYKFTFGKASKKEALEAAIESLL